MIRETAAHPCKPHCFPKASRVINPWSPGLAQSASISTPSSSLPKTRFVITRPISSSTSPLTPLALSLSPRYWAAPGIIGCQSATSAAMMYSRYFVACCVLLGSLQGTRASSWAIYEDADCQTSVNTIPGENGYPDGVCTDVAESAANYGTYKGFAFITMDTGCNRMSNVPTDAGRDTR